MKSLVLSCLLLAGSVSFAAIQAPKTYNLKMELSVNGKMVSAPIINVIEGEKALITQDDGAQKSFIEVMAKREITRKGQAAIFMDFTVGQLMADGSKSIKASPKIYVAENNKAEIRVAGTDSDTLDLSVIVNEVKQ